MIENQETPTKALGMSAAKVKQQKMVGGKIMKQDTKFRETIPASLRLAVTLRYLASGDSFSSLMYTFRISKQVISKMVPEVCEAIISSLKQHIKRPTSEADWKAISQEFQCRWNFPHYIGSIDGKHVQMVAPQHSGSLFYNYKGTFSIVFLGVADANYNLLYADVGCQGRISDGGVFKCTSLYKDLENNTAHVPRSDALPGRTEPVPYVLVGDDAFAMSSYLMKPYPGRTLEIPKRIYNYRLSRALSIIENVFGIMSSKFRVLLKPIALQPNKVESVGLACAYLHNFLRRSQDMPTPHQEAWTRTMVMEM
ncbi:unnamed protein product [Acanthoscelides obtectus]|uniref:DDE Tnp4 domain-containing protein n=1 Tax=Acanthoscelides obtectus TaxID=200917 RepID=A0A9P0MNA7_ACAOB|nr:unnamed protein product [Acanthoscelides obtectus]CAK1651426.1 Protein ALP1-like [Acanthoscelides obtectus]